ncbi:MAG: ammonium transporter [Bryobacterales bacterium]|nr:ammonium transporter [Bryobacterales bacterium]MDE0296423.1 ammonium transporter [Bryobacterales bacterium]MDE0432715.1 ammonium transporter [Bryobacterales bacterium]
MKTSTLSRLLTVLLFLLALPALAQAEEAQVDSGDNAWILVCSALVLLMTGPGLALFYGGLVRKKNLLATMMQSFMMMAVITVLWGVVGYSLAFSPGNSFIGGFDHLFLNGVGTEANGSISHLTFMTFQLMFAIITPALISGAFAERMKFTSMLVFMVLWSLLVYLPMAHMVWGPGGLMNAFDGGLIGCLDFAGGTVVHISSGVSALVCALVLGKRIGYPSEAMRPNSLPLSFIGACLLWVGWFGFNAGSALAADGIAASAFVATHFAAAAAVLGWLVAEWMRDGKPSMLGGITGAVAGLVCITPGAGFVSPMAALIIGFLGGLVCYFAVAVVKAKLNYDDSLDAFGVHGVGGTLGAILTGVFATKAINDGFDGAPMGLLEGNMSQFVNNILGALLTWVLAAAATYIILKIVDATMGLRVDEADELEGLDLTQHGEEAYLEG